MRGTVQKDNFCREIFFGEVTLGVARVENSWISLIEKSGGCGEFRAHATTWARAICDAKHLGNEFGSSPSQPREFQMSICLPLKSCFGHLGARTLTRADLNLQAPPTEGRKKRPSRTNPEEGEV